jgi:hypothetical protein
MLQTPAENPHATLITLFLNAVHEAKGEDSVVTVKSELQRAAQYLGTKFHNREMAAYDPEMMAVTAARECTRDGVDVAFGK